MGEMTAMDIKGHPIKELGAGHESCVQVVAR